MLISEPSHLWPVNFRHGSKADGGLGALHRVGDAREIVVLHVAADARQPMHHRHANLGQVLGIADARQLQDVRRADGSGGEDDLAPGLDPLDLALARELDQIADGVRTAVDRLLSAPADEDVQVLLDAGITAVYLPDADDRLASRVDAAPSMQPAGSESPDSRVWTIEGEASDPSRDVPWWRVGLGAVQVVVWLLALVLTAPVRRRPEPEPYADEAEDETDGAVVLT